MTARSPDLHSYQTTTTPGSLPTSPSFPLYQDAQEEPEAIFRFLDLPLELRRKIYGYVLPPRHHKIALQAQNPPFFCNTLSYLAASYPFGRRSPSSSGTSTPTGTRTPPNGDISTPSYKVLTQNFRVAYPQPSIFPEILRVCRTVSSEAQEVLYGARGTVFDFGTSVEVLERFWSERSPEARACVKEVRVARGVSSSGSGEAVKAGDSVADEKWDQACRYMKAELRSLRSLDLKFWSEDASEEASPVSLEDAALVGEVHGEGQLPAQPSPEEFDYDGFRERRISVESKFRKWAWTQELLAMHSLREVKLTWWACAGEDRSTVIDPWVAAKMVSEPSVRDKFVRAGVMTEAAVDLRFRREELVY